MAINGGVVLVTGMSGVGKSTVLAELARRGHRVVDTDYGGFSVETPNGQLWIPERIETLLDGSPLILAGCVANQGDFYPRFDAIVLLSAPLDTILARVAARPDNPYGKTAAQRAEIAHHLSTVEPLLRAGATTEIDTRRPAGEVADELEKIAWRDQTVAPPLYGRTGRKGMPVIDHVILGVHHLDESRYFYEHALAPLGVKVVVDRPELVGFGGEDGRPFFWLAVRETTHRVHVAFTAPDRLAVDAFHAAAMRAGGVDNGGPGLRPLYHENYYGAFAFDADGNNIEAVCHTPA